MKVFKIFIRLTLLNLFFITGINADIVRRAAVDVGSGETKLTIADVDTETNRIVKVHHQDCKVVALRKDLATSLDGTLSKEL
jgi:exopolyphosphatase / guanosine-5'-triphosphate,3'-diphosphate pyrophosphatase